MIDVDGKDVILPVASDTTRVFSDSDMFPFGKIDENGPPLFGHSHFSLFNFSR
jgi:hypothetical protein